MIILAGTSEIYFKGNYKCQLISSLNGGKISLPYVLPLESGIFSTIKFIFLWSEKSCVVWGTL